MDDTEFDQQKQRVGTQYNAGTINIYGQSTPPNAQAVGASPVVASGEAALESLNDVELRRWIESRLSFDEVKVVWNVVFGNTLTDARPNDNLTLAIMEMIARAGRHSKRELLLQTLRVECPHIVNPR